MQSSQLQRRAFIRLVGGAAATWPLRVRAQQGDRSRRLGVLAPSAESDPEFKRYVTGFTQGLAELGWTNGRNLQMDVRGGTVDRVQMFAKELVDLRPDVILSITTPATAAVQRETQTIPIVFAAVGNPVGEDFVASLSRPGGNISGFMIQEPAIVGRWLELLTEIAPRVTHNAALDCQYGRVVPSTQALPSRNPSALEIVAPTF
jgi:putative ABC transport system substrate-binding protein